jgi:hypothetical protein
MEHRWGQRFEVSFDARLHLPSPNAPRRAVVRDISASGAFIEINTPLSLLSYIRVELRLPVDGGQSVMLPACVVRHTRKGVGVEWCDAESLVVAELLSRHAKVSARSSSSPVVRLDAEATIPLGGIQMLEGIDPICARSPFI